MSLTIFLYLASLADHLRLMSALMIFLSGGCATILMIGYLVSSGEKEQEIIVSMITSAKRIVYLPILALLITIFIPGETTMYMMMGSSYLSNSQIPSQVSEILNLKLADVIKNLKKEEK